MYMKLGGPAFSRSFEELGSTVQSRTGRALSEARARSSLRQQSGHYANPKFDATVRVAWFTVYRKISM
jgi:hypothetical protein